MIVGLGDALRKLLEQTVLELPSDVLNAIRRACEEYSHSERVASICKAIEENLSIAKNQRAPLCQDTGLIEVFIRFGRWLDPIPDIIDELTKIVASMTKEGLFRPNAVDPLRNVNTGNNLGPYTPFIHMEYDPNLTSDIYVCVYLAGGGCSALGRAEVSPPSLGIEALSQLVVDTISRLGVNACPPLFIGIGIGGTAEMASILSKKALLRRVGVHNLDPLAAEIEKRILDAINRLPIGFQGLGEGPTALWVSLEYGSRHPATFAIAISVSCWALRRRCLRISKSGSIEILDHI